MTAIKRYAYFFTRQDLSPEQQLVQTAHVALKLGYISREKEIQQEISNPSLDVIPLNPDETYFTVVGVRNKDALGAVILILEKFKFEYEVFYEPDIGNEPTSIALYPLNEDDRGILLAFNLLRMGKL